MIRWDCHAHLFGPYDRFPLAAERSYTPPEATLAQYEAVLARQALTGGVLVQPSAYGGDASLLMHALSRRPLLRGVLVARAGTALDLAALRRRGVRALRFSQRSGQDANFTGSAGVDDLMALAPRLADAGLHAELWTDHGALVALAPLLRTMPVPVVIDHLGGFDARAGLDQPGFVALRRLLAGGHVHVKLTAYRNLLPLGDALSEVGAPFVQALLQDDPTRLLWGSDWPHLRVSPVPDAVALQAQMRRWVGDEASWQRILGANAQALYG
ncbi:amidohydrolase [Aquabacterium sp. J223]|uniref:amidohydrolase family protein n=1 Tax=Aquabacterium sp. J223 TaxID=2898431 RepID=UPI0021ADD2B7|nr:amidohydrolase family protein [Aquabacterium sp. J223]UUX95017.1 amidohydrolase family protein [Aquabacterium sp. J223]